MEVERLTEETAVTKPEQYTDFVLFEKADDQLIAEETEGLVVKDMAYQFVQDGRTVTGLSIAGVNEATKILVRHGYNVKFDPAIVEETPTEFRAKVKVTYTTPTGTTLEQWGYSRQPKTFSNGKENQFAFVQACSKAQRNAARQIVPEKLLVRMLELALQQGHIRKLNPDEQIKNNSVANSKDDTPNGLGKVDFTHRFRFELKGADFPLEMDTSAYGFFTKQIIKPFQAKHNIRFFEETLNGYVTAIKSSKMEEKQHKEFMNLLGWTIKALAKCQPEEYSIIMEEIKCRF